MSTGTELKVFDESEGSEGRAIMEALRASVYPGARDASIQMVMSYCQAGGLDPLTKPVHIVPMSVMVAGQRDGQGKQLYDMRDVIMPGIELYRIKAHRTGQYAGCSDTEFGPTITSRFAKDKGEEITLDHPEWAKVTVRRLMPNGTMAEFTGRAIWLESYATESRYSSIPNAMWRKRRFGQLEKCAEAMALRRGFPEIGAVQIREEMEGKVIESTGYIEGELVGAPPSNDPVAPSEPAAAKKPGGRAKAATQAATAPAGTSTGTPATDAPSAPPQTPLSERIRAVTTTAELETYRTELSALGRGSPERIAAVKAWNETKARLEAQPQATSPGASEHAPPQPQTAVAQ